MEKLAKSPCPRPTNDLAGHGEHGLAGLLDLHVGEKCLDEQVHNDGEQGGQQRGDEGALGAAIGLDDAVHNLLHDLVPREGRGEGKSTDDSVQALSLDGGCDTHHSSCHVYYRNLKKFSEGSQGLTLDLSS